MRFTFIVLFYAVIGSCAFVWSTYIRENIVIAFTLFILYAVFGGLFFNQIDKRNKL